MNYYERHIGDYLKDTAHLSLLEHGIYTRLLDVYYTREAAIPNKEVMRLVGAKSKEEKAAVLTILAEFFEQAGDTWVQPRCEREIDRYRDKSAKARASINARWERTKNERNTDVQHQQNNERNTDVSQTNAERNTTRARPQTPDSTLEPNGSGSARARAVPPPEDVSPQVWADWLALRKQKRATVTPTVVDGARVEAGKAGMPLEAFLRVWVNRGSQGLEAAWLKPAERAVSQQSFRAADLEAKRAEVAKWSGGILGKPADVIEMEGANAFKRLG